ncbi:putative nuclease HARBI1 isoform X3 [Antennarius striatus]|uniref:putative nuclease HARBI1 isoform X3 n=1 Tax=Antennarius striatus TaxID=241820 RepID=UPI0035B2D599
MACPFDDDPIDEGAALIRRELNLRREVIIRPRLDVMSNPDSYLFERYRFTSQSITYIHDLIRPHICNITNRSHALTSQQVLCVALRFFANGGFLYHVGDAQHLSKSTVCRAVRRVCLALKRLLPRFVSFPGNKSIEAIKEEFQKIAGIFSLSKILLNNPVRNSTATSPRHYQISTDTKPAHHLLITSVSCTNMSIEVFSNDDSLTSRISRYNWLHRWYPYSHQGSLAK